MRLNQKWICSVKKQLTRFWSKSIHLIENEVIPEAKLRVSKSDHVHISVTDDAFKASLFLLVHLNVTPWEYNEN